MNKAEYDKKYYQDHKVGINLRHKKYVISNNSNQKYYQDHKTEENLRCNQYKQRNRLQLIEDGKQYYQDNKHACKSYSKQYRQQRPDKYSVLYKEWRITNKDKVNERNMKRHRNIIVIEHVDRAKLKEMYDGKCVYCGQELGNSFHTDHLLPVSRYEKIGKKCPHSYNNCAPSCVHCNETKGSKTPLEFMWNKELEYAY